jgi:hypothetical protein
MQQHFLLASSGINIAEDKLGVQNRFKQLLLLGREKIDCASMLLDIVLYSLPIFLREILRAMADF